MISVFELETALERYCQRLHMNCIDCTLVDKYGSCMADILIDDLQKYCGECFAESKGELKNNDGQRT